MSDSQYSSSSTSSNKYVSGNSVYQTPSYGQNYTNALTGSAVKETNSTTYISSNTSYGSSGITSYGNTAGNYGTPGVTSGNYATSTNAYGNVNLGNSGVGSATKTSGLNLSSTYERKANLGNSGVSGSGYSYQTKKF